MQVIIGILYLLPKNLISIFVGWLSRVEVPEPVGPWINETLCKAFGINTEEAEKPIATYKSFEDVFTRKLKPGLRPVEGPVVSPCDGTIARSEASYGLVAEEDLKSHAPWDSPGPRLQLSTQGPKSHSSVACNVTPSESPLPKGPKYLYGTM